MRIALTAIALISASASVFFACTEENRAGFTENDAGDAGDAGYEGGVVSPPDDDEPVDSGEKIAPNGCVLKSTGSGPLDYTKGAKAENIPRTDIAGAVDWTNPAGALAEDG